MSWQRWLLCFWGRHSHSRGKARHDGNDRTSVCRYCGVAMRKDFRAGWIVDHNARSRD